MVKARVVKRYAQILVPPPTDGPIVVWKDCAEMPCGCRTVVGIRIDLQEQACVAVPCPAHAATMARFMDLFRESTNNPQDRPTVEVAAELMDEAFA